MRATGGPSYDVMRYIRHLHDCVDASLLRLMMYDSAYVLSNPQRIKDTSLANEFLLSEKS